MIKKRTYIISFLLGVSSLISSNVIFAKKKIDLSGITLSAYEIIEKVDKQVKYLQGLNKIQYSITNSRGNIKTYKVILFKKGENHLFLFKSISRGQVLKVLYNNNGQIIYTFDVLRKRLYRKRLDDKFQSILHSGFFYIDIANLPLLDNYTPKINGVERFKGKNYLRITNIPLDKSKYSKLNILVDHKKDFLIKRIDFFDYAGVLMKSMNFRFGMLPIRLSEKKTTSKFFPISWEMVNMQQGTISIMEFLINDKIAKLHAALFDKQYLED